MLFVDAQKLGGTNWYAGPWPAPGDRIASPSFLRSIARFAAFHTSGLLNGGMVLTVVTMPRLRVFSTCVVSLELPRSAARLRTGTLMSSARSTWPADSAFRIAVASGMIL